MIVMDSQSHTKCKPLNKTWRIGMVCDPSRYQCEKIVCRLLSKALNFTRIATDLDRTGVVLCCMNSNKSSQVTTTYLSD